MLGCLAGRAYADGPGEEDARVREGNVSTHLSGHRPPEDKNLVHLAVQAETAHRTLGLRAAQMAAVLHTQAAAAAIDFSFDAVPVVNLVLGTYPAVARCR